MKKLACFFLFVCLLNCSNLAVSEEVLNQTEAEAPSTPKFKTEDEAIAFYKDNLTKFKTESLAEFPALFGVPVTDDKAIKTVQMMDATLKMFKEDAGKLVYVDACKAPKLGNTVQRVGFMFMYEHNFGFADVWLLNTAKGWHMANYYFNFDTDTIKTLEKIPTVYFAK
jgi:hypothetical protein